MIRATLEWADGHPYHREHKWEDSDWYWVQRTWDKWVERKIICYGVIWLASDEDNSDHVVLDHLGDGYLFGEKL